MDEEDVDLLKDLATIMQKIEQKGLLKLINTDITTGILSDTSETKNDNTPQKGVKKTWMPLYNSTHDPEFKVGNESKTLCVQITRSKKRRDFFYKMRRKRNFFFRMDSTSNGVLNAIGLVKINYIFDEDSDELVPVPLPRNVQENNCLGGSRPHNYLKVYFSKAWSEKFFNSIDICPGQKFEIDEIWTLENTSKVMLPCKAVYRWDSSKELVVNAPPWLSLVGATRKDVTSIWISYREDNGKITRGHLSKRGKGNTLFRCSRKEPWNFYRSMFNAKKNWKKETGAIEFMVAFTPETLFQNAESTEDPEI